MLYMKKLVVLVAPGFEEIEFSAPVDILRRLGFDVMTAGIEGREVKGAHDVTVLTDTTLTEVSLDDMEALILPGGPGSWFMRDTPVVTDLVAQACAAGKTIAAICAAPIALAKAGILNGKKVSAYPDQSVHDEIQAAGATIMPDRVTVDGNIVTANGPGSAMAFGYALGKYFGKADEVAVLKQGMIYGCPAKD